MNIKDEAVEAAKRIRDTAMRQTLAARIPESGHFGAIAQDADWLVDHLTAALPHMGGVAPTHRHKKRGTEYVFIGIGKMQVGGWFDPSKTISTANVDMREVAIYRSVDDGSLWVRPREEFEDGRFETLASHEPVPTDTQEDSDPFYAASKRVRASLDAKAQEGSSEAGEVVAWMHPSAGWANHDRSVIYHHCRKDGSDGGPVPLVRQSSLTACQQEVERLRAASIASGNALYEARVRIAELMEALEPFAALADYYDQNGADDEPAEAIVPNIGDFRRARAALGGQSNEA